ncbi:ABC transporter substrate-binding protein [Pelagibacterium lentulum]|uniref:ABC transporter substrate-binding protein n=1 Tax=Pelagibacterium lentulum TaxID=2029865 RepID=A0A916RNH8_9HYPH|nr:ABC transporter substrate-binding protein [Pelagibacterium lentulum]GGA62519.1 ABC transporter substrate-binding protein [Pelagibacterium lentulum]
MTKLPLRLAAVLLASASYPAIAQEAATITVYTSQPTDQMTAVIEAFNADHPEITVEVFRSGTTEVMSRLQAEIAAGQPQADVLLIADSVAMTQVKNMGELYVYEDAPIENLPASVVDPDMTFFGTKLITTGIIYNTDLVETPPTSWAELTDPEIASGLIMPSPLYSGAAVIHLGTMVQQPEFGWDYYDTLADNGAIAGQGNGTVIEAVARGEKPYGVIIEYMALNAKANGSPVDFVFPEEGVTSITQPVAILARSNNIDAAKVFVDWQLSQTAQQQSVEQGYFPIFAGVEPPAGYPAVSDLTILEADPAVMLEQDEANKMAFADLFGG